MKDKEMGNLSSDNDVLSTENLIEDDLADQILEAAEQQREEEGGFGVEKFISVVFATVGGFEVPSGASMDEIEEARGRQEQLNSEIGVIVAKYGGEVDKVQSSLVMAYVRS